MKELIVVKQLPVIEEKLRAIKGEIEKRVFDALSMECTEETVKSVKAVRADLNSSFAELETKRKDVRMEVLAPYNRFEVIYKDCVTELFKSADQQLKSKIDEVEDGLKAKKRSEVKAYFDEYLASKKIDFLIFDMANINVTLTASLKSLKEQAKAFIDKVSDELELISTQGFAAEILVDYKATLNCAQAITTVVRRHMEIEQEQERAKVVEEANAIVQKVVAKVDEIAAPVTITMPSVFTLTFRVTASKEKLKELKRFLTDGGYDYE